MKELALLFLLGRPRRLRPLPAPSVRLTSESRSGNGLSKGVRCKGGEEGVNLFYVLFFFLNNFLLFFCLNFGDYVNGRKDGELIVLGERNLLHIFSFSFSFFFFFFFFVLFQ